MTLMDAHSKLSGHPLESAKYANSLAIDAGTTGSWPHMLAARVFCSSESTAFSAGAWRSSALSTRRLLSAARALFVQASCHPRLSLLGMLALPLAVAWCGGALVSEGLVGLVVRGMALTAGVPAGPVLWDAVVWVGGGGVGCV